MNYEIVRNLLDTAVKTVTGLPTVHLENTRINASGDKTGFTRTTLLPAEPIPLSVSYGGSNQYIGLYQVDVFQPVDYGTTNSNGFATSVMNAFPRGLQLIDSTSGITVQVQMCWQQVAYNVQNSWYVVPVMVRWAAYQ